MKRTYKLLALCCCVGMLGGVLTACGGAETHTHRFSVWQTQREPTCGKDGLETHACSCGYTEEKAIAATGQHEYGEWETITSAKCDAPGESKRTCSACGTTQYADVTVSHSYLNGVCLSCGRQKDGGSTPTTTAKKPNATKAPESTKITIKYKKTIQDKNHYANKARIDSVNVSDGKVFISFAVTEHYGGGYDSFATDIIFYDSNNNILDVKQAMYVSNIGNQLGATKTDYSYIPDGTKTILIASNYDNDEYLVSKNHGSSSMKFSVPKTAYDKAGYGNAIDVLSYNVYEDKVFFTCRIAHFYGGGFDSFATTVVFYDNNGNILDSKQACYATNIQEGQIYYDDCSFPEGTARIELLSNAPTHTTAKKTTTTTKKTTTTTQDAKLWTFAEAQSVNGYANNGCNTVNTASDYMKKACETGNKTLKKGYMGIAQTQISTARSYAESALSIFQQNYDVTLTNSNYATAREQAQALLQMCDAIINTEVTESNCSSMDMDLWDSIIDVYNQFLAMQSYSLDMMKAFT